MSLRSPFMFAALLLSALSLMSLQTHAITIDHDAGTLTLDKTPTRVVALAFSFVDALAVAGVSPVGIADDGDKTRIINSVRTLIGDWQSVGSRYQPSLEAIAALKPDLIIADSGRHQSIYRELSQIAPTLMLASRGITYHENLAVLQRIALALDKTAQVKARLKKHQQLMRALKSQFNNNDTYQFAIITDKGMWLHSPNSYAGSVIKELGLSSPLAKNTAEAYLQSSFEQLLKTNPDWLLVGQYTEKTVLDKWQTSPLWKMLSVAKSKQLIHVPANLWSLTSGMLAAEQMAQALADYARP